MNLSNRPNTPLAMLLLIVMTIGAIVVLYVTFLAFVFSSTAHNSTVFLGILAGLATFLYLGLLLLYMPWRFRERVSNSPDTGLIIAYLVLIVLMLWPLAFIVGLIELYRIRKASTSDATST